jgi:hypothetical protein
MATAEQREQREQREQDEQRENIERPKRETRDALIGERVIRTLGAPGDLLKVQVRELWEGRYRVNVFVGPDFASARVARSYFVVADADGNIVESTPPIVKRY